MGKKKLTIVCIHSFKPEYVKYMPCLSSLTQRYIHGKLTFKDGFMSSVLNFLDGENNILAFFHHSNKNYLKWTKKFVFLEYFGFFGRFFLNLLISLKAITDKKHLMLTYNIPIKKLQYFDAEIKSWKRNDIHFIFFYKLDKIAHKYGTFSKQVKKYLEVIDNKLKKIDFDILFSDHGMMDVKEKIKVPESKICFLDSTLARYWGEKEELKKIAEKLPLDKGQLIDWKDKRYGQLIFQANPGVLFLPNYWQGNKNLKAMHGYNCKIDEMKGFYLIPKKGKRQDLSIQELHKIYAEMKSSPN